jgi:hypothetical protein
MPYGKIFLESLPRYATTHDLRDVERFFHQGHQGQTGKKPQRA